MGYCFSGAHKPVGRVDSWWAGWAGSARVYVRVVPADADRALVACRPGTGGLTLTDMIGLCKVWALFIPLLGLILSCPIDEHHRN